MIQYSIAGACKFGITKFGYHSGQLLCQVGKRLRAAKFGWARFGATKFGLDSTISHLRHLRKKSLKIQDTIDEVPTCNFSMIATTLSEKPLDGQLTLIAIGTLQNRFFAGHLANPKETKYGGWYQYDCSVQGFTKDLRRRLVQETYEDETAGEIVQDLITTYAAGFTWAGDMQAGEDIEEIKFNFVSVLDACNELAQRSNYVFYVDPRKEVHFKAQDKHSAPWDVSDSEVYTDLNIDEDSSELRNRVIVRYSNLTDMTESFKGDSTQKVFHLAEKPHDISSLTVNGSPVTYGTRYAEDNESNDFSINYDAGTIHTQAHATLTAANTLACTYAGKAPARIIVNDTDSQSVRASLEGGDGIYESVIEDRDIFSLADAQLRAKEELRNFGSVRVSASYQRRESVFAFFTNRLRVGMQQDITARGRNHTLIIDGITISVIRHEDNRNLTFLQEVSLSPIKHDLTAVFRKLFKDTSKQEENLIETEVEYNLNDI